MRSLHRRAAIWEFDDKWKYQPFDIKPVYAVRERGRWMRSPLTRMECDWVNKDYWMFIQHEHKPKDCSPQESKQH